MTIANGLLLFVMIWFLVFMLALAMPFQTQGEKGEVVPGTPASAPAKVNLMRRARFTTALSLVFFLIAWGVIWSGLIKPPGLNDLPMPPSLQDGGTNG